MRRVDGTFGLNFLLAVLRYLEDCKRHRGVCPDGTENKSLTKARGCLPVGWLMGPVSSQQLSLGPGAPSAPLCSATGGRLHWVQLVPHSLCFPTPLSSSEPLWS